VVLRSEEARKLCLAELGIETEKDDVAGGRRGRLTAKLAVAIVPLVPAVSRRITVIVSPAITPVVVSVTVAVVVPPIIAPVPPVIVPVRTLVVISPWRRNPVVIVPPRWGTLAVAITITVVVAVAVAVVAAPRIVVVPAVVELAGRRVPPPRGQSLGPVHWCWWQVVSFVDIKVSC
jgi:hypothetical protein